MSCAVICFAVCLAVVMAVQSGKFVLSSFIGCELPDGVNLINSSSEAHYCY